jgi:cobalt/nickel transport protein
MQNERKELSSAKLSLVTAVFLVALNASAHFQVLLPSVSIVTPETGSKLIVDMIFTHPMEQGPVMNMGKPVRAGVWVGGNENIDLLDQLQRMEQGGVDAYRLAYDIRKPADYVFYLEPAPYWEPAEQKMIVHYTKVVVDAYGAENGWDRMVGFPIEIEPLVRPYGLWSGNVFRGVVRKGGEPVPFAEIEVEYYNWGRTVEIPSDSFVTQVIKADANGVFSYAMPKAGWWGFAALVDGDKKMENPDGDAVDVELGALIWVNVTDM